MAKVGAQRAAELTGKSKSTIQRAMNSGKISFERDTNGRRVVDVSELERVFGLKKSESGSAVSSSVEQELQKATAMLETERLKMRVKMLEEQLLSAEKQIDDLKTQRDSWQKQASQVLLTSQYSQKQAEELQAELKERERKAQERRKRRMEMQAQQRQPQNQNVALDENDGAGRSFWKKITGIAA